MHSKEISFNWYFQFFRFNEEGIQNRELINNFIFRNCPVKSKASTSTVLVFFPVGQILI